MKNLLPFFMMLLAIQVFAQSTHTIDFEPAGTGSDWTWIVTENGDNPPLEFIANPVIGGINTSATVAKFTARVTGNPWALTFTDGDGEFTFDGSNYMVSIMVYKPVISNIAVKFEGTSAPIEIQIPNTVTNQWEEITFDFSGSIGNTYSRIVIIPDFEARTQENIVYFDNIQVPDGVTSVLPEPAVAAPTPTQDPGDVISMFSDAYTDVPVDTWLTVWSSGTLEDVSIAGNPTKKYSSLNFAGIETTGANLIDVTGMTHFHIDIWSPDNNDFKVKLVDFGADGLFGGGDDTEHEIIYPAPASETWISYDIPLSGFTNLNITGNMAQYILSKPNLGTLYVDNMFFYASAVATEPDVAAPSPTQDPGDVISMFSDAYTDVPVDTWLTVWSDATLEDVLIAGNPTKKYTSVNFFGVETTGPNLIDASAMSFFHMDVWTPDANDFKVKLVDFGADGAFGGGDDSEHELTFPAPATGTWISYDIPLADFTGLTSTSHLAQLIMVKSPLGTLFIDNVYYYAAPLTEPDVAAPIPTEIPENVLSIYSDAYTDVAGTDFNPWWGQATVVTVDYPVAGNNTIKYASLNYQGTQLVNQDVSGYEFFHVDFWTANSTALDFFLISPGPVEVPYTLPITQGEWVSLDIPLSAFAPVNLEDVFQFKVVGNGDVWFDNWYFWKTPVPAATTWTGNVDNNWHIAGNWSDGIPGATSDVTIPAGLSTYPTIGSAAECNNILIESDATGAATLVDDGYLTVNGTATVEKYYPTGGTTNEEWHLIGSPVSDATAAMYTGYYLQWYQESADMWHDIVSVNDPLTSLQGFAFYAPNDGMTFDYVGTLGNGNYSIPISATGPISEHWNLFGNPYPSAIDWDLASAANIANLQTGAVYYLDQATGNYQSYNGGIGAGSQFVAPGQGFFVSCSNDGANFTVNNSMRAHEGIGITYKADFDNMLTLKAEGNGYNDVTYVRFDENATSGIDKEFDAFKIFGVSNPELPQLFTIGEGKQLSINVMQESETVVAGFKAGIAGIYTISADEITGFESVMLEDIVTGAMTDLTADDYSFSYSTGDPEERFIIHLMTVSVPENLENVVNIFVSENEIHISLPADKNGEVSGFNLLGQQVFATETKGTDNVISVSEKGIYIIKVNIEGRVISKKVNVF